MRNPKFTLIELLVVISIIAILSSMVMPALAKAQAKAKIANSKNNFRQIGMNIVAYLGDQATRPVQKLSEKPDFGFGEGLLGFVNNAGRPKDPFYDTLYQYNQTINDISDNSEWKPEFADAIISQVFNTYSVNRHNNQHSDIKYKPILPYGLTGSWAVVHYSDSRTIPYTP